MIYTRNKRDFTKTIVKIDHVDTRQNILDLVKQRIGNPQPLLSSCNSSPRRNDAGPPSHYRTPKQIVTAASDILESPAPRSHNSSLKQDWKLSQEHTFDYTYNCSSGDSQLKKVQDEYLWMLEDKIKELEGRLIDKESQISNFQAKLQAASNTSGTANCGDVIQKHLRNYYHSSRTVIVNLCVGLIEYKKMLLERTEQRGQIDERRQTKQAGETGHIQADWVQASNPKQSMETRLQSINQVLSSGEQILEIYRRLTAQKEQSGNSLSQEIPLNSEEKVAELTEICEYQRKTIEFLRKNQPSSMQFNETKLLRHEISRVSSENEKLIMRLAKHSPAHQKQAYESPSPTKHQMESRQRKLEKHSSLSPVGAEEHQKMLSQLQTALQQLKEEEDKSYKWKQQKEYLIEELKKLSIEKERQLSEKNRLEEQVYTLQYQLKKASISSHSPPFEIDANKCVLTPEQLCRDLKPYPNHFKLLMTVINQYEEKISILQDHICEERLLKDKFMQWSSSIYKFMKQSDVSQQLIDLHMAELFKLDQVIDSCKLDEVFRKIKSLSIGVREQEIEEMQSELQEYVHTLSKRQMPIKELEIEDGSSLAPSEA